MAKTKKTTKTNFFETKKAKNRWKELNEKYFIWEKHFETWKKIENADYPLGFIGKKKRLNELKYSIEEIVANYQFYRANFILFSLCLEAVHNGEDHVILEYDFDSTAIAQLSHESDQDFFKGTCYLINTSFSNISMTALTNFCGKYSLSLDFSNYQNGFPLVQIML